MSISFASKIRSVPKWDQMSEDCDLPALLKECKILAGGSSLHQFGALTTIQAYKQFFNCKQKYNQTIFEYTAEVRAISNKLKQVHGAIDHHAYEWSLQGKQVVSTDAVLVAQFFEGLHKRYSNFRSQLCQSHKYPTTLDAASVKATGWEEEVKLENAQRQRQNNNNNKNNDSNRDRGNEQR